MTINQYLIDVSKLLEEVANGDLQAPINLAIDTLVRALRSRKPVLVCGNGGSAADAMHIAGELVGRYLLDRPPFKVISLGSDAVITTAWSNDFDYDSLYARQVDALGENGGALWCLSTSGNSENIVQAVLAAKNRGMKTVAFTGRGGGRLSDVDILVAVPSMLTPHIQEVHRCLYHYVCEQVEQLLESAASTRSGQN